MRTTGVVTLQQVQGAWKVVAGLGRRQRHSQQGVSAVRCGPPTRAWSRATRGDRRAGSLGPVSVLLCGHGTPSGGPDVSERYSACSEQICAPNMVTTEVEN